LIGKASDETAAQTSRILLTFFGTSLFCLFALSVPDTVLLIGGGDNVNLPFAGSVSFFSFMVLGPAILIVLRVYLQIYVEHCERLERITRRMPIVRAPMLVPRKNPLIKGFSGFVVYALLPLTMLAFAYEAAGWTSHMSAILSCTAAMVIASHAMLPLRRLSWRTRTLLSLSVAIMAGGAMIIFGAPRRPLDLSNANLSGQSFNGINLKGAYLTKSNLVGADLTGADLAGARLAKSNLRNASLRGAKLIDAYLGGADLTGADLTGADLTRVSLFQASLQNVRSTKAVFEKADLFGANLTGADLTDARLDSQRQLDGACGANAKLPAGLTLKACQDAVSPLNPRAPP
jgi:uncharacterized protein YjbI with pentapeptide repeats